MNSEYVLVRSSVLPSVLLKTLAAKEMLERGECSTVGEAVQKAGISRSAFYKYRDGITRASQSGHPSQVTLQLLLSHQPGVLSQVLQRIAGAAGNIRTINQEAPNSGIAPVKITFEASEMSLTPLDLVAQVASLSGVVKVELAGLAEPTAGAEVQA